MYHVLQQFSCILGCVAIFEISALPAYQSALSRNLDPYSHSQTYGNEVDGAFVNTKLSNSVRSIFNQPISKHIQTAGKNGISLIDHRLVDLDPRSKIEQISQEYHGLARDCMCRH